MELKRNHLVIALCMTVSNKLGEHIYIYILCICCKEAKNYKALKSYKDTKYQNTQRYPRFTENPEKEMKGTGTAHTHSTLAPHQPLLQVSVNSLNPLKVS